MSKFQRSYRLVIDPQDGQGQIVIALPLTVQFWMQRNQMASLNYFTVDIYNLGEETRNRIFQDRFETRGRTVTFEAGYDTLSVLFRGVIFEANTAREGNNLVTRIEARDGNFDVNTAQTFQSLNAGQTVSQVFRTLIGDFPTVEVGAIGDFPEVLQRPVVLNGNTYDQLKKYSDNQVFIDKNRVFILKNNEVIEGDIPSLTIASGLLETPRRDDGFLTVPVLFEPRVTVGQVVSLESQILPVYNGQYKVVGLTHQGIISEAVNGQCTSVFNLWVGNNSFVIRDQG